MFILCLDVSLLFLPLGWSPNLSLFCMNSGSCSHLVRLQPSAHDAVLTPRACATLIFGDENEMALCDARPAMVSLWINTSTYLYHFFWMNIQNCNLFLV